MALTARRARQIVDKPEEFDREVVRGALFVYNAVFSDLGGPSDLVGLVREAFGWLPATLAARAERAGMNAALFQTWSYEESPGDVLRVMAMLSFQFGALRGTGKGSVSLGGRTVTALEWYREIASGIEWEARLAVQATGSTELVALPKLTALRQATAYAVAAAHQRGWLHLVRPCLYLKNRKASNRHYFLADDPRQRFCSTSHSNLYRQYKYIDKHGRPDARRPRRHK